MTQTFHNLVNGSSATQVFALNYNWNKSTHNLNVAIEVGEFEWLYLEPLAQSTTHLDFGKKRFEIISFK